MKIRTITVILAGLTVVSCTGAGGESSAASARSQFARFPHSAVNADCFFQRAIDHFEVLNASNMLVFDGRRRAYHLELSPPSMDLRHAFSIGFESASGRVCGNPGDKLKIGNGAISRFPVSIIGVYRLDEATQQAVRAHFGQATVQPEAPEDQDAEAVEELVTEVEEADNGSAAGDSSGELEN